MSESEEWRVLVVDDNKDSAEAQAALLETHGYVVETAVGRFDREILPTMDASKRPHVMMVDYFMTGKNGLELVRELQQLPWFSKVLVIFVSGHSKFVEEAEKQGFLAYLKPLDGPKWKSILPKMRSFLDSLKAQES